jgi:hypothetical protein
MNVAHYMRSELKLDSDTIRKILDLFETAGYTTCSSKHVEAMAAILHVCPQVHAYLTALSVDSWAISQVPFNPLGNLTSNDAG